MQVTNIRRWERGGGRGFCAEWQRVLKEKQVADFGRDRDRKVSNRARLVASVLVRHRECRWHDGRAAGFNSKLGAVVAWLLSGESW
jgi:hypothetical protein